MPTFAPPVRPAPPRRRSSGPVCSPGRRCCPTSGGRDVELAAVAGTSPARAVGVARRWNAAYAAADAGGAARRRFDGRRRDRDAARLACRARRTSPRARQGLSSSKSRSRSMRRALTACGRSSTLVAGWWSTSTAARADDATAVGHFATRWRRSTSRPRERRLPPRRPLAPRPRAGGGRLIGEGCHFVDLCSGLTDRPLRDVSATAIEQRETGRPDGRLAKCPAHPARTRTLGLLRGRSLPGGRLRPAQKSPVLWSRTPPSFSS